MRSRCLCRPNGTASSDVRTDRAHIYCDLLCSHCRLGGTDGTDCTKYFRQYGIVALRFDDGHRHGVIGQFYNPHLPSSQYFGNGAGRLSFCGLLESRLIVDPGCLGGLDVGHAAFLAVATLVMFPLNMAQTHIDICGYSMS